MKPNIVFLDIDGVLNSSRYFMRKVGHLDGQVLPVSSHEQFDPDAVALLNQIEGVEIVVSSSWRYMGLDNVRAALVKAGVVAPIVDATPEYGHHRGAEIAAWLHANSHRVGAFVIIDDDGCAGTACPERFVLTTFEEGLTAADVTKARAILEGR